MKTVIYKSSTLVVIRITEENEEVKFSDLKDDEDMMPLSLWNNIQSN